MKRRVGSTLLIAALVGSYPLPAGAAARRARVEVTSVKAEQLDALRAAAEAAGAEVRIVRAGRTCWLEVSADTQAGLAAALKALRRAAKAAGLKPRIRADSTRQMKAISRRPVVPDRRPRPTGRTGPAALLTPPLRPRALSSRPAWADPRPNVRPPAGFSVRAPRAPPA